MSDWREPGLFNNYHEAKLEYCTVTLESDGSVEITNTGGHYGDDVYTWLTIEQLELLARAARALVEYEASEDRRVCE